MMPSWQFRLLLGLGMLGCGWAGYYAGAGAGTAMQDSAPAAKSAERDNTAQARDRKAALRSVLVLAGDPTSPVLVIWEQVSALDSIQIQEALGRLRMDHDKNPRLLRDMLFSRWAAMDPQAAMDVAMREDGILPGAEVPSSCPCAHAVLLVWLKDDPQAALAYLSSHPDLLKSSEEVDLAAKVMLVEGMGSALKKSATMAPELQEQLLDTALAPEAIKEPGARQKYLDLLDSSGSAALQRRGWKLLFETVCVAVSPETAQAGIQNLGLPAGEAAELWATVLGEWAESHESDALKWFVKRDGLSGDPSQSKTYEDWLSTGDTGAMEWLGSQPPQDAALLCRGVADFVGARFAAGDPMGGWGKSRSGMAALERFLNYWQEIDPKAADHWAEANLTEESGIRLKPQAPPGP